MKRGQYQLSAVCVREKFNGNEKVVEKGIHAESNFASDKEALERFWQVAHKDLIGRFDRIVCSILRSGVRVGTFRFPEKRA